VHRAEKCWNFLGYDVGGGHNDAGTDAKVCKNSSDFICIYEKIAGDRGSTLNPIITAVVFIFKHYWHTTGSWKNASGVLEKSWKFL